jgi:cyclomaltodextrinase
VSARRAPAWVGHAVLWHVYPLGFLGAPSQGDPEADPVPRLRDLIPWLDHLIELGANALLLGPVFQSESHGYDTSDHFRIDTRLGTDADFDDLVEQAHSRGIRVVLDGVFNHVSRSFPQFTEALAQGPQSPSHDWFRWDRDGTPDVFEGHQHLVSLNHIHPAVVEHVTAVIRHWCARGVDGWRLDAAYAVPASFWAQVAGQLRAELPEVWLLGEVIHGDYAAVVAEAGLDSVTQYELWKAIWSALNDRNLFELAHALQRHDALLDHFVPQTFVGNHDVTRIASRLTDPRHLAHALVVLFTVGGVPSIYSGDEQGLLGVKEERIGGDDAIRPAFPTAPGPLPPGAASVLRLHQQLIAVRRRHPWLHASRTVVEQRTNTALLYRSAAAEGEQQLLVALNLDDGPVTWQPPAGGWTHEAGTATASTDALAVPAHGWGAWSRTRSS